MSRIVNENVGGDARRTKKCAACNKKYPLTGFHVDKSRSDGRCYICKVCRNQTRREKYEALKKSQQFDAQHVEQQANQIMQPCQLDLGF
jgi:hypothetical protein